MSMNLTLAVVLECTPQEFRVEPLESTIPITVHYTAAVQAALVIRPGQLVALDTTPTVPEIVYRWHVARVDSAQGDKVRITDYQGQARELVCAPGLPATPQAGDQIFVTMGLGAVTSVVWDTAVDGRPAHPDFLKNHALPEVERFYRERAART